MNILIACEESQAVCVAFRKKGFEAYSCDIQECSGGHPEWHLQCDVNEIINQDWDMIIAHPPCTYLSKAGARWLYHHECLDFERLNKLYAAREFFMKFYNCKCKHVAIENPTPLLIADLPKPTQIIQPYFFGEPYSKRTLLWLKNLPPLKPTEILSEYQPYLPSNTSGFAHGKGGSRGVAHNAKVASKTFKGVAAAMAEQWSEYLIRGDNNE